MGHFLAFAIVFCVWGAASYRLFEKEFGRKLPSGRTYWQERRIEFLMWPWILVGYFVVVIAVAIHAIQTIIEFVRKTR